MTKIIIVKDLLGIIGTDATADKIIASAAMQILDMDPEDTAPASPGGVRTGTEKLPPAKEKPSGSVKKPSAEKKHTANKFDTGKMIALLRAGWSIAKIADEMGVSDQTIRNHIKREGIILKGETK